MQKIQSNHSAQNHYVDHAASAKPVAKKNKRSPLEIRDDKDPKVRAELAWLKHTLAADAEFRDLVVPAMKGGKYKIKTRSSKADGGPIVVMTFRDAQGKKHVIKLCTRAELADINESRAIAPFVRDARNKAATELGIKLTTDPSKPPPEEPQEPGGPGDPNDPVDPNDPTTYGPELQALAANYPELASKIAALSYGQLFILDKLFYMENPAPNGEDSAVDAIISDFNKAKRDLPEDARLEFDAIFEFAYWECIEDLEPEGPVVPGNMSTYGIDLRYFATYYPGFAAELATLNYEQLFLFDQSLYQDIPLKPTGVDAAVDAVIKSFNKTYKDTPPNEREDFEDMMYDAEWELIEQRQPTGPVVPGDIHTYRPYLRLFSITFPELAEEIVRMNAQELSELSNIVAHDFDLLTPTGVSAKADQFVEHYNETFSTTPAYQLWQLTIFVEPAVRETLYEVALPSAETSARQKVALQRLNTRKLA